MSLNADDPRLGDVIKSGSDGDLVFLGFPYDIGVARNGGRVGARGGPSSVRGHMRRMGTVVNVEYGVDLRAISISDAGDIPADQPLEAAHSQLRADVRGILAHGRVPFVVGGGNDQSYANAAALLDVHSGPIGVVNVDAHLDVRPLKSRAQIIESVLAAAAGKPPYTLEQLVAGERRDMYVHSGTPFRQLLEDTRFAGENFVEFAAQGGACSAAHVEYLTQKGGRVVWLRDVKARGAAAAMEDVLQRLPDRVFLSFDLDSVSSADAPGVSAPGTIGLSAQDALDICFLAGKSSKVCLFDLSEYNPSIEDYRTGRLVVNMFYSFALGYALRLQGGSK